MGRCVVNAGSARGGVCGGIQNYSEPFSIAKALGNRSSAALSPCNSMNSSIITTISPHEMLDIIKVHLRDKFTLTV